MPEVRVGQALSRGGVAVAFWQLVVVAHAKPDDTGGRRGRQLLARRRELVARGVRRDRAVGGERPDISREGDDRVALVVALPAGADDGAASPRTGSELVHQRGLERGQPDQAVRTEQIDGAAVAAAATEERDTGRAQPSAGGAGAGARVRQRGFYEEAVWVIRVLIFFKKTK